MGERTAISVKAHRVFWKAQSPYDCTVVSSRAMQRRVEAEGIRSVVRTRFRVEPYFLDGPPRRETTERPARLLYAGRLQKERSFDLLLQGLLAFRLAAPPAGGVLTGHVQSATADESEAQRIPTL